MHASLTCVSYTRTATFVHRPPCIATELAIHVQDIWRIPAGHTGEGYKSRLCLAAASTINGQTMQIGLWISLYGFRSRTAWSAKRQYNHACTMRPWSHCVLRTRVSALTTAETICPQRVSEKRQLLSIIREDKQSGFEMFFVMIRHS